MLVLITANSVFAQYGSYVQLFPGDSTKIIFQVKPDQNYSDVNAYINFYSQNNKVIRKKLEFEVTDSKNKYIHRDQCTNKVFSHWVKGAAYVTVDHVSWNSSRGKADDRPGVTIAIPVSNQEGSL